MKWTGKQWYNCTRCIKFYTRANIVERISHSFHG